jgi:UDP-3-O-[3-hydroxymyristoyl] glucosamine N-acyltransferase
MSSSRSRLTNTCSSGELAAHLHLPLRGDAGRLLTGAATLEDAQPHQLAFASGQKYFDAAARSAAGCVIAPPEFPGADGQTIIESPQPRAHFAQALALLFPVPALNPGIHPTAVVEEGARVDPSAEIEAFVTIGRDAHIGARTRIGAGSTIGAATTIGDDCLLRPRVSIYERVTIGARCVIHSGVVIGADGFGFEMAGGAWHKVPQVGTVTIGDDVEIGANTCIDRATLGATVIGDGAKLDNMVHIGHNCTVGKHVVIAAQTGLAGGVSIGDYAVIGGQVGVGDKARIESKAIVGSGAGILTSKIVRAGEPVWGTPARPLRQYLEQLATLARLAKRRGK